MAAGPELTNKENSALSSMSKDLHFLWLEPLAKDFPCVLFPVSSAFSFSAVLGRVAVLLPGGTVGMVWGRAAFPPVLLRRFILGWEAMVCVYP